MTDTPILYSFRRCPFAMRARMALITANIQCQVREVDLKNKPAAMLAASPKGTVPVLCFPDGKILEESLDIMLWALRDNPEHMLLDEAGKADMLTWIQRCDTELKPHLVRYKYPDRFPGDDPKVAREQAGVFLQALDDLLADREFLMAPHLTLLDFALLPFVRQFAKVDDAWFATAPYPRLRAWQERLIVSPLFVTAMQAQEPWQPEDAMPVWLLPRASAIG